MKCNQVEEFLPLYTKNALNISTVSLIAAHLQSCKSCAQFAEEYEAAQKVLNLYQLPEFSDAFHERIRLNVLTEIRKQQVALTPRPRLTNWLFSPRFLVMAALSLLLFAFGMTGLFSSINPTENNSSLSSVNTNSAPVREPISTSQSETDPLKPQPVTVNKEKINIPEVNRTLSQNRAQFNNTAGNAVSSGKINRVSYKKTKSITNSKSDVKVDPMSDESQSLKSANTSALATMTPKQSIRMNIQTSNPKIQIIMFSQK